jgi:hypothetical protein
MPHHRCEPCGNTPAADYLDCQELTMQQDTQDALPLGWFRLSIALPPGRAFVVQRWAEEAARERANWESNHQDSLSEFRFTDDLQYNERA